MDLKFRPLLIGDKPHVDRLRALGGNHNISHGFAAMYIWQVDMKLSIHLQEDMFTIRRGADSEHNLYFPCGGDLAKLRFLDSCGPEVKLQYINEHDIPFLERHFPGEYMIEEDRDSFEYVYSVAEQVELPGSRFADIRKKLRSIEREGHRFCLEPIDPVNISRVRDMALQWNDRHTEDPDESYGDTGPTLLALRDFFPLGLSGVIMCDEERDLAYIFGSPVGEQTFDIHSAKCVERNDKLDHMCKHLFCKSLLGKYTYINREEDLGEPGIRRRKLDYRPCHLIHIYSARRRT